MRLALPSLFILFAATSCGTTGLGSPTPFDLNGRWEINTELGNLRPFCITITNNEVARTGECDDSPGTSTFAYHPPATISDSGEIIIRYSVGGAPADPLFLFDLHRYSNNTLRGTMVIFTNSTATQNDVFTNMVVTRK
jgi:hypothetical protein